MDSFFWILHNCDSSWFHRGHQSLLLDKAGSSGVSQERIQGHVHEKFKLQQQGLFKQKAKVYFW